MKDVLHRVLAFVDHYRWTFIAFVVSAMAIGATLGMTGCDSMTPGFLTGFKVDRAGFEREVVQVDATLNARRIDLDAAIAKLNDEIASHNVQVEKGYADLDAQDAMRAQILDTIGAVATSAATGTFNPASLIPLAIGVAGIGLGVGASADNRRKDRVIRDIKKNGDTPK